MAIAIDFETFYAQKEGLGIKQQGMSAYIRDPRFDAYLISICDGENSWAGHRSRFNWSALDGQELLSHNAAFDSKVYAELVKRGLAPKINIPRWHCTANLSTYICARRDLGRAVEFCFGVQLDKSTRGAADGKTWEDLIADDGGKSMLEYARRDAAYCWRLWNRYGHLWPEREKLLSELTIRQGWNGVQIDLPKLDEYYSFACKARLEAERALPWTEMGKKPTSTKAIAEQCRIEGIPCPPVKAHEGEEAYDAWEATHAKFPWVKAYTDYRVIHRFVDILETIKSRLYDDGCFPFDLLYFGAHTGRWSGSGGFNMQNMRKEPLYFDDRGLVTNADRLKEIDACLTRTKKLPEWVVQALDLRALFIARPGKKMIISDLSQIEPRVLAWFVKDRAMLEQMMAGRSPYEAHARATMGWTGGELKKENKDLYALAKARVLGLGYGCGWKKFITVAYNMAGLDITKDDPEFIPAVNDAGEPCLDRDGNQIMTPGYGSTSRRIVEEYRAQNPLIAGPEGIWKRLDDAFKASVGEDFEMELPSGRLLRYLDVQVERKAVQDPDNPGQFRYKRCYTALIFNSKRNAVVREALYGGLLTENLVQATARDVFAEHLLALDKAGITPLWNVHDEAVTETSMSTSAKDVEAIMSVAPEWMPGLPVAAEAQEVPCYKK